MVIRFGRRLLARDDGAGGGAEIHVVRGIVSQGSGSPSEVPRELRPPVSEIVPPNSPREK